VNAIFGCLISVGGSLLLVQNLLTQLGIGNLSGGLTQLDLNRILQTLGLGTSVPAG